MHVGADLMPPHSSREYPTVYPVRVQPLMQSHSTQRCLVLHNRIGKFQNAGSVFSALISLSPLCLPAQSRNFMQLCSSNMPINREKMIAESVHSNYNHSY